MREDRIKGGLMAARIAKDKRQHHLTDAPWHEVPKSCFHERVLLEQGGICKECGLGQTWNGKPLVFQLDHANGDNKDNRRENLRMICPNCHTQTPTWGFKKRT
jgi:5-methylcytosine-specific restriction endonuclease McrA